MSTKNIRTISIDWKSVNQHVKRGIESGFNIIDVVFFVIRHYMDTLGHLQYTNQRTFTHDNGRVSTYLTGQSKPMNFITWVFDGLNKRGSNEYNHVTSPVTRIYHRVFKVEIAYYICDHCKWQQFRVKHCNLCGRECARDSFCK
jgi:predicted aldo/keto reductase-like oxidoreductase